MKLLIFLYSQNTPLYCSALRKSGWSNQCVSTMQVCSWICLVTKLWHITLLPTDKKENFILQPVSTYSQSNGRSCSFRLLFYILLFTRFLYGYRAGLIPAFSVDVKKLLAAMQNPSIYLILQPSLKTHSEKRATFKSPYRIDKLHNKWL